MLQEVERGSKILQVVCSVLRPYLLLFVLFESCLKSMQASGLRWRRTPGLTILRKVFFLQNVGLLHIEAAKGLHEAWTHSGVLSSGAHRQNQLTFIRRNLYDHKNSICHIKAEKILPSAEKDLGKMIDMTSTSKLIHTAYCIARNNRPYVACN